MHGNENTIYDAMLYTDELQLNILGYLIAFAGVHDFDRIVNAEYLLRPNFLADQIRGERSCNNWSMIFMGKLGDCPDVVKVTVGAGNSSDFPIDTVHNTIIGNGSHGN